MRQTDLTLHIPAALAFTALAVRECLAGETSRSASFLRLARREHKLVALAIWGGGMKEFRRLQRNRFPAPTEDTTQCLPSSLSLHGECNVEPRYLWDSQTGGFVENPNYAKDF